jgi:hypothetical protein
MTITGEPVHDLIAAPLALSGQYPWSVPLPGWVARFNRRVTNPALRPVAGVFPTSASWSTGVVDRTRLPNARDGVPVQGLLPNRSHVRTDVDW